MYDDRNEFVKKYEMFKKIINDNLKLKRVICHSCPRLYSIVKMRINEKSFKGQLIDINDMFLIIFTLFMDAKNNNVLIKIVNNKQCKTILKIVITPQMTREEYKKFMSEITQFILVKISIYECPYDCVDILLDRINELGFMNELLKEFDLQTLVDNAGNISKNIERQVILHIVDRMFTLNEKNYI